MGEYRGRSVVTGGKKDFKFRELWLLDKGRDFFFNLFKLINNKE